MYTSTIGRIFLNAYNKKYNTQYTAKEFFTDIFIPLFFDHNKYMMTGGNSPLENPKLSWDDMIKGKKEYETNEKRKERIEKIINKIETCRADSSIAIGYGVLDLSTASASQITSLDFEDNKDDIYLSWVGAGLGITVAGGITILFNDEKILLDIFEGWSVYRNYLEQYPRLKGNQINTWNGIWIAHRYDRNFDEDYPTSGLNPLNPLNDDVLNISTRTWLDILWAIATYHKSLDVVSYIYKIGQSNSTLGFIPFKLQEIISPYYFYKKIFGDDTSGEVLARMKKIYATKEGLQTACERGVIGVKALEPRDLQQYKPGPKSKVVKCKSNEEQLDFNLYIIWIIAMMNNEQMWEISQDFARALINYEKGAPKNSRVRVNNVNQLFEAQNSRLFIANLIPIIGDLAKEEMEEFSKIGKIVNDMPKDNYPYLITLIKFQYALLNK